MPNFFHRGRGFVRQLWALSLDVTSDRLLEREQCLLIKFHRIQQIDGRTRER
jgi:hypothetical protein